MNPTAHESHMDSLATTSHTRTPFALRATRTFRLQGTKAGLSWQQHPRSACRHGAAIQHNTDATHLSSIGGSLFTRRLDGELARVAEYKQHLLDGNEVEDGEHDPHDGSDKAHDGHFFVAVFLELTAHAHPHMPRMSRNRVDFTQLSTMHASATLTWL